MSGPHFALLVMEKTRLFDLFLAFVSDLSAQNVPEQHFQQPVQKRMVVVAELHVQHTSMGEVLKVKGGFGVKLINADNTTSSSV